MTTRAAWPAERFYWAVLDAPGVRRAGQLPVGLTAMLDDDVPIDVNGLHALGLPLADGRLAVCAAERRELADLPHDTLSLCPLTLPPFLEGQGITPGQLNLLVGAFEPRPLRRARIKRHATAATLLLFCGLLVAVGLQRRATYWRDQAQSAHNAAMSMADSLVPGGRPADLASEAAHLRGTHDALLKAAHPPDAALSLAALLHAWPANVPSKPQSIAVNPTGVSFSVSLESDPAEFLRALTPPAGWALDEPRLNSADTVTRLSLQLRPTAKTP
ncbi:MAG: hypothetical protein KF859_11040 [Phycisphaeraceae bacterium]|nr:hypothetical protein [Phycisphaeraceae bacterium]